MTVNKLTATFGVLEGETLELHEGLNVITAPNESGKSTWCAFIRAMLYGIDTSERQKGGFIPDKLRYAPWSGSPMQGEMELNVAGRGVTLTRTTKNPAAPMREFNAVFTGSATPIQGLTSANAGDIITGVSRDVFTRTAFIRQGGAAITGSPELEKRINSIVSTGEEGASYTEADETLRAWQRSRRWNRKGRLPELEARMADARSSLGAMESDETELERVTSELERKRAECRELETGMMEQRNNARREALSIMHRNRSAKEEAAAAHADASRRLSECRAALGATVIGIRDPEQVETEARRDVDELRRLETPAKRKISSLPPTLLLIAGIIIAVLTAIVMPTSAWGWGFAAAAVLCFASAFMFAANNKKKAEKAAAEKRISELLDKYRAADENGIKSVLREYLARYEEFSEAERTEAEAARREAAVSREVGDTETRMVDALDFSGGSGEAAQLGRRLTECRQDCERLAARAAELRGRMGVKGDPILLRAELERMEAEHAELEEDYEALSLAIDTLRQADAELQSRFSPELGRLASEYMSLMTGGKYTSVLLDRDLSARVRRQGDSVSREQGYLSAGTLDLMYFAVRLAVCELALPKKNNCPVILDDTLVNLDPERTEQAMRLLSEIAKTRQVILFTCK